MDEFHIQWHITDRCNLRCKHCYQDSFDVRNELSWPKLKLVCDSLIETMRRKNWQLTLSLTGGEPLLKDELWEIIDYLKGSEYVSSLSIISNGILLDKHISKINDAGFKALYISLDGITPGINDSIRGEGVFAKVVKNIKLLKSKGLCVFIMYTLLSDNIKEAESLLGFSKSLGIDGFILERFIPEGKGREIKEKLVTPDSLNKLYQEIFKQCGLDYIPEEAVPYHALKVEIKEGRPNLFGAECVVGKFGCALLPCGDIFPCRRFNLTIGNLLKTSLSDIWQSSEVLKQAQNKESLKGRCKTCGIKNCRGCRALAYALSGDYLAEDKLCRL